MCQICRNVLFVSMVSYAFENFTPFTNIILTYFHFFSACWWQYLTLIWHTMFFQISSSETVKDMIILYYVKFYFHHYEISCIILTFFYFLPQRTYKHNFNQKLKSPWSIFNYVWIAFYCIVNYNFSQYH